MILAPFKWIVALFFNWSQALFNDPGWAVVGMSVLLSLLLTPLYVWIERRKNSDKAKSAPMQAEIDKIEAVYKGRERYYYTREIQRRYRYSPWTAMIPTLGLLVQIPFLLAAYHYLSELPLFNGVSFWYIKDLSKPDTIAVVAGLPINLLAILMTVINLVSGWRYAESGKPKERIQYMSVAAIFLFLLYNCAASVVLYWTLSNALSFVRSEIFFRKNTAFVAAPRNPGMCESFRMVLERHWGSVIFSFLFAIVYCLTLCFVFGDCRTFAEREVFRSSCVVAALLVLVLEALVLNGRKKEQRLLSWLERLVLKLQGMLLVLASAHYFTECPLQESALLGYISERGVLFAAFLAVLVLLSKARTVGAALSSVFAVVDSTKNARLSVGLPLAAVLYSAGVILIWQPLMVYASEPQSFAISPGEMVFCGLLWLVGIGTAFVLAWKVFLCHAFRRETCVLSIAFGLTALAYLFLCPAKAGTLQGAELVDAESLVRSPLFYLIEMFFLIGLFLGACWLLKNVKCGVCIGLFVLLHVVAAVHGGGKCFSAVNRLRNQPVATADDGDRMKVREPIQLSRKHRNILVFMLDMVQGKSFEHVMNDENLAGQLVGFVWYPNSASVANMTCSSMPAIYGGPDKAPGPLNQDTKRRVNEKASEIMQGLKQAFADRGYDFKHYNCNRAVFINPLTQISPLFDHDYLCKVMQRADYYGDVGMLGTLRSNALLQAVPFALKTRVYNRGKWLVGGKVTRPYQTFSQDHMFYEALPQLTSVTESECGGFSFFHVEATHNPWGVPDTSGRITKTDNVGVLKWIMKNLCGYFQWMRENGVYDNTRIVLVSDHGLVNMSKSEFRLDSDPMKNKACWKDLTSGISPHWMLQEQKIQMFNNLLAVKDFGDQFEAKTDWRLMSNSDTRYLLESDRMSEAAAILPNERDVYLTVPPSDGSGMQWWSQLKVLAHFKIIGNVFDLKNWRRVK